jgi:hypothetical protein
MFADGLITVQRSCLAREPTNKLEAAIKAKSLTAFAKIDHAAPAANVDLLLRPTTIVIFGSPKRRHSRRIGSNRGILKALISQDASGATQLSYDDPVWITKRHG